MKNTTPTKSQSKKHKSLNKKKTETVLSSKNSGAPKKGLNKPKTQIAQISQKVPMPQIIENNHEQIKLKRSTKKLLETNIIESWQASLREAVHIDQITKQYPNAAYEAPPTCPKWAGGQDSTTGKKPKPNWTEETILYIKNGLKTKQLLPWEAALKFNQPVKKILKLLTQNNVNLDNLEASPTYIAKWARYEESGLVLGDYTNKCIIPESVAKYQEKLDVEEISRNNLEVLQSYRQSLNMITKKGVWSNEEKENLKHYWKLELLGTEEIAYLLNRPHKDTVETAQTLKLKKKHVVSTEEWCGVKWDFEPDGKGDPKALPPNLQRLVAETSATRFSLLYEKLKKLDENNKNYKSIERELNKILSLHTRIFSKYLSTRSRKYKFVGTSAWQVQKDLEQAGRTAIFECLRRWHPNRNIRFSRGTVNIAINREMLAWLEQQRLVDLPDKIRSVARQLKHAFDNGKWDSEVKRLKEKAGENCVREASKHQNTYAYLHTVPLMETYNENEAEFGGITGGAADCIEEFSAICMPENDTDITSLLLEACNKIPENERRAVLSYHGLDTMGNHIGQKTLEEIGLTEGVTKERIRQRILKGKQRMRKWLERINIKSVGDALASI